jgi:serine/threonine protein kinase
LKTQNILLNEKYEAKISDFGISSKENLSLTTTSTAVSKGTPSYQSPEQFPQLGKQNVGKPADVYCFGSVIYEVIFEKIPWSLNEDVESFDDLYQSIVIDKKRPKILTDEGK